MSEEFLDQLAVFECKLFDVDKPTLTGAIVFEGRNLLNVDDAHLSRSALRLFCQEEWVPCG